MNSFGDPKLDPTLRHSLTKLDFASLFCEFLECAVHQILASRKLYDARLFENRKLYHLYVKRSRHPGLNAYIHHTIDALKESLSENVVEAMEVIFLNEERKIVEKVVIDIQGHVESFDFHEMEDVFRSLLVAIHKSLQNQPPLPQGCAFDLAVKSNRRNMPKTTKMLWHISKAPPMDEHLETLEPIKSAQLKNQQLKISIDKRSP